MLEQAKHEAKRIEAWLITMIENYRLEPSVQLAKAIDYYFARLINVTAYQEHNFQIFSMKRYWRWVRG